MSVAPWVNLYFGFLAVGVHVNQRKTGALSVGLDRYNVLVVLGTDFQLGILAARTVTSQFPRTMIGIFRFGLHPEVSRTVTDQDLPILPELVVVKRHQLRGRIVGLILQSDHSQAEPKS